MRENDAPIRVMVYEDKPDLRDSLIQFLDAADGIELVGAFADCNMVAHQVKHHQPDIILMDIHMPGTDGIQGTRIAKEVKPEVSIIMLTVFDDDRHLFEAICAGASGYLLKKTPPMRLLEAIREAAVGGAPMTSSLAKQVLGAFRQMSSSDANENLEPLTTRERDILAELVNGSSYKMIADNLGISIDTVRTHLKKIYGKLHVNSMSEAVSKAIKRRLV